MPPRRSSGQVQVRKRNSALAFDYTLDFDRINFREHPEWYRVGVGEQGVLLVEPYKSEILPHWRFRTPDIARESSEAIWQLFIDYGEQKDFVGMDMARKFLQMGFTRARRYANHKGGIKYDGPVPADKKGVSGAHGRAELPRNAEDPVKAESARIFWNKWQEAKVHPLYLELMKAHNEMLLARPADADKNSLNNPLQGRPGRPQH
jgi:hypothetical protein